MVAEEEIFKSKESLGDDMDLTGSQVLLSGVRAVGKLLHAVKQNRRLVHDEHVRPIYEMLELVHKDYVIGFVATKKAIRSASAPSEVLEFLKDLRRGALMIRGQAVVRLDRMLDEDGQHGTLRRMYPDVARFCEVAKGYLFRATQAGALSWYSEYVRFVEADSRDRGIDCWDQSVFGNDARSDLLRRVEETLDSLEVAFRNVTHSYLATTTSEMIGVRP